MGIEAIGSMMGRVASTIGREAPAVGRISAEMPTMRVAVGRLVNEGPVGLADLKATVPLGEIKFNSEPLSVQGVLAEAEAIISQAKKPAISPFVIPSETRNLPRWEIAASSDFRRSPRNDRLVEPMVMPDEFIHGHTLMRSYTSTLSPMLSPALEPAVKAGPQTESGVSNEVKQATAKSDLAGAVQPVLQEQEVEEVVTAEAVKRDQKEALEEEELAERKIYLEDGEVSVQRKQEIREAINKARVEADRLGLIKITGWLVARFLPPEHEGNRSQVVKKTGPDGSYQETVESIAGIGELESEDKAVTRFNEIVSEKKPVKHGKDGTPVAESDVARVFKYRLVKSAPEATLEDLGLTVG